MADSVAGVAGVVLAAGRGTRLHPLTLERPKALCPFGDSTLVDHAIEQLRAVPGIAAGPAGVAVNAHHCADQLALHLLERAHLSSEPDLLGSAGALGAMRTWIDGRAVLRVNGDTVHAQPLEQILTGWNGTTIRLLVAGPEGTTFGPGIPVLAVLTPWDDIKDLTAAPRNAYASMWVPAAAAGRLEVVAAGLTPWFDCGTAASLLAANLWWSGGRCVIGAGAVVDGEADRCLVFPGAKVHRGERLKHAIRTTAGRTVLVR